MQKAKITKPYYRTIRQMLDGSYMDNGFSAYIRDPRYAPGGEHDIRSFYILQKEFIELLEYIEPATANNRTYSLQLRNLLIRVCTEIESNLKAILLANSYSRNGVTSDRWNMTDYCKINRSHFLSEYKIYLPYWSGHNMRQPFKAWREKDSILKWYKAYNDTKHARGPKLEDANLGYVVEAMTGLVALISAQFYTEDFIGPRYIIADDGYGYKEHAIGNYFIVEFPIIPPEERYHLDIEYTKEESHSFSKFNYL